MVFLATVAPKAGWFTDPTGEAKSRWWNGEHWEAATIPHEPVAYESVAHEPVVNQPVVHERLTQQAIAPEPDPNPMIPAGWYTDPAGAPNDRWWNGDEWQAATQPRAAEVVVQEAVPVFTTMVARPVQNVTISDYRPMSGFFGSSDGSSASRSSSVSVYRGSSRWAARAEPENPSTSQIWTLALLPLLGLAGTAVFALTGGINSGLDAALASTLLRIVGLGSFVVSMLLAYSDSRELRRRGFSPFSWGWILLGTVVYMIGRAFAVHGQSKRGIAPLVVWLVSAAVSGAVAIGLIVIVVMPLLNR